MTDDTEGISWTMRDMQRADRSINHFEHEVLGYPTGRRVPIRSAGPAAIPYIVTEKQHAGPFGANQNIDVGQDFIQFNSALQIFNAMPYISGAQRLTDLEQDDEILVAVRFINGALFTGQMFLLCAAIEADYLGNVKYPIEGDVLSGPDQSTWIGTYVSGSGQSTVVDIQINPTVANSTASGTRQRTCRITARNMTGFNSLVVNQVVYVQRFAMPFGATQWGIFSYDCATL